MKPLSRRRCLKAAAAASGVSLLGLAGCLSNNDLEIVAKDTDSTALGDLVLTVTVKNPAEKPKESQLSATVTLGGQVYEKTRTIAVPSKSNKTYELRFDIPLGDYSEKGEYDVTLE